MLLQEFKDVFPQKLPMELTQGELSIIGMTPHPAQDHLRRAYTIGVRRARGAQSQLTEQLKVGHIETKVTYWCTSRD